MFGLGFGSFDGFAGLIAWIVMVFCFRLFTGLFLAPVFVVPVGQKNRNLRWHPIRVFEQRPAAEEAFEVRHWGRQKLPYLVFQRGGG